MSKRFTESDKWKDPWFRRLPIIAKMFWVYACDHCDHAGVISPDWEAMSFYFGHDVTDAVLSHFEKQIQRLDHEKLFIRGFIKFQYGKLSKECKPHAPVFKALEKHGLVADDVDQNEFHVSRVDGAVRDRIIERDGLVCAYTGRELELWEAEIDHILPRSRGGTLSPTNLVVCDAAVNARKSDLSLEDFCKLEGWNLDEVKKRLRERTSKPTKGFQSLQDKDKDKDKDLDGKEGAGGKPATPPNEAEVMAYAEGATIPIPKDCALRWITDRETSDWMRPKGLHLLPVLPNWQADLRGYAQDWKRNDDERKARNGSGGTGGSTAPPKDTPWNIKQQIDAINDQLTEIDASVPGAWGELSPAKKEKRRALVEKRRELRTKLSGLEERT